MELKRSARENVFVRKSFYSFFLPSLCSCIGLAIGGLADCVFVGNVVGPVRLTAISIGQPIYMLFNTISYSLSIGGWMQIGAKEWFEREFYNERFDRFVKWTKKKPVQIVCMLINLALIAICLVLMAQNGGIRFEPSPLFL